MPQAATQPVHLTLSKPALTQEDRQLLSKAGATVVRTYANKEGAVVHAYLPPESAGAPEAWKSEHELGGLVAAMIPQQELTAPHFGASLG